MSKEQDKGIEEIAEQICDMTGYGQALHPNDFKQLIIQHGNQRYQEGVADTEEKVIQLLDDGLNKLGANNTNNVVKNFAMDVIKELT